MSAPEPGPGGPVDSWQKGVRKSSPLLGLGVQLAGTMLFYVFAGFLLDRWLKTEPWLLILGSVIGMIAFFIQIVRVANRFPTASSRKGDSTDAEANNEATFE